jgi:hypothetical protein
VSLVQKFFALTAKEKAVILVVEAALLSVALLLELLVLKHYAAQRAGDVVREADLALGQGLAVDLVRHDAGADIARDHGRSHEHVPSLVPGNLADLLLLLPLEPLLGTPWRTAERTMRPLSSRTMRLPAAHVPDVAEEASTPWHLDTWVRAQLGVKAKREIQNTATGV